MSDEVTVGGTTYISSKRASHLTHYSQDYIGYLARTGQITAQRMGGLWYVVLDSLKTHQEVGKQSKDIQSKDIDQTQTRVEPSTDPESFVGLDGKNYISASRASKSCGYNQDYVGQLARSGQISARQVGNRWYVDEVSLRKHKQDKDALLAAVQADSVGLSIPVPKEVTPVHPTKPDLEVMTYYAELGDLMPNTQSGSATNQRPYDYQPETALDEQGKLHDITNVQAKNRISIHTGAHSVSGHSLVLQRPQTSSRRGRPSGTSMGTGRQYAQLASAALTIVIVVSLGFAGVRSKAVYSFFSSDAVSEHSGVATVAQALDPIASFLEELLTKELRYTRKD